MTSLPRSTEDRLRRLVDPKMYRDDAYYSAITYQFRNWLVQAQMAMEDEEIDPDTIECVLNRMVYGHLSGTVAYERTDFQRQAREMMEAMPLNMQAVSDLLNGPTGLVHGPHMTNRPYTHEEGLPRRRPEPPNEHVTMGGHG